MKEKVRTFNKWYTSKFYVPLKLFSEYVGMLVVYCRWGHVFKWATQALL